MSDGLRQVEASYRRLLQTGELRRRVEALETLLERCTVCPRDCLNNRLNDEIAACYSGRLPIVSSYTAHFGEEPPLTGTRGAGNIFFGNCNLRWSCKRAAVTTSTLSRPRTLRHRSRARF